MRIRHSDFCEPWGYVAPIVAAVVTRATGARHIYLIGYLYGERSTFQNFDGVTGASINDVHGGGRVVPIEDVLREVVHISY